MKKTKIIATLGPSSNSLSTIKTLIETGMDVARINLSHGNRESHGALIQHVKEARKELGRNTAVLLDTRGPEIRVGEMAEPVELVEGMEIVVCGVSDQGSSPACSSMRIEVNYDAIAGDVNAGDRILLDDGKMELQVIQVEGHDIRAKIVVGGLLTSRKRVSLPGVAINLPSVSLEDIEDIRFGIKKKVDFIAASFIRKADDVLTVRKIIADGGGTQGIIAKIENRQGVENLDEILEVSDGLMVARGDLGVEVAAEEVPIIQKRIIRAANLAGKPVITATQMLESMITSPTPTRAEATDVANAVMDGTDAVMLSGETAMGRYPQEAVRFLVRCATIAEASLDNGAILSAGLHRGRPVISDAIAYASCAIAAHLKTAAILCVTTSGSTARVVAMFRPQSPVVALSPVWQSLRKLQIVRGVIPVICDSGKTMDDQIDNGVRAAFLAGIIAEGDKVAITAGLPLQTAGTTNMLRVHTVTAEGGVR